MYGLRLGSEASRGWTSISALGWSRPYGHRADALPSASTAYTGMQAARPRPRTIPRYWWNAVSATQKAPGPCRPSSAGTSMLSWTSWRSHRLSWRRDGMTSAPRRRALRFDRGHPEGLMFAWLTPAPIGACRHGLPYGTRASRTTPPCSTMSTCSTQGKHGCGNPHRDLP